MIHHVNGEKNSDICCSISRDRSKAVYLILELIILMQFSQDDIWAQLSTGTPAPEFMTFTILVVSPFLITTCM